MTKARRPSYLNFDKDRYAWRADVDYSEHPELYRVGRGEQGVLICEPYKSTLVALWRFKTKELAAESASALMTKFRGYLDAGDFVGADMARKFLQMGFTRARRYANYRGGMKYNKERDYELNEKGTGDAEKVESANIFFKAWKEAEALEPYPNMKKDWRKRHG